MRFSFINESTAVNVPAYVLHRDSRYFSPGTDEFWPERWLPDQTRTLLNGKLVPVITNTAAFNPFSVGPRSCLGKGLALTELTLTLAYLLSKYDFRLAPGSEKTGCGSISEGPGRHREAEYQLYDHVTAAKNGPIVQLRLRQ